MTREFNVYPGFNIYPRKDGSITITCGAWILLRSWPDGHLTIIDKDAPDDMIEAAKKAAITYHTADPGRKG